jgi:hypothetical protein
LIAILNAKMMPKIKSQFINTLSSMDGLKAWNIIHAIWNIFHNNALAAQLYGELKDIFQGNAVKSV